LTELDKQIGKNEEMGLSGDHFVRLEVFHPVAEGYRASDSRTRYFPSRSMEGPVHKSCGWSYQLKPTIRIDPVSYPAVIDIAEITSSGRPMEKLCGPPRTKSNLIPLKWAETACRVPHAEWLRVLSFGNDPSGCVASITAAMNKPGPLGNFHLGRSKRGRAITELLESCKEKVPCPVQKQGTTFRRRRALSVADWLGRRLVESKK